MQYLIRTDRKERRTTVLDTESSEPVAVLYTDYRMLPDTRDLQDIDVVNPQNNTTMGRVHLFTEGDLVSLERKIHVLGTNIIPWYRPAARIDITHKYKEGRADVAFNKVTGEGLEEIPRFEELQAQGIVFATYFGDNAELDQIACYEKDGELAAIVNTRGDDPKKIGMMGGLAHVIAHRVLEQEYVFELVHRSGLYS